MLKYARGQYGPKPPAMCHVRRKCIHAKDEVTERHNFLMRHNLAMMARFAERGAKSERALFVHLRNHRASSARMWAVYATVEGVVYLAGVVTRYKDALSGEAFIFEHFDPITCELYGARKMVCIEPRPRTCELAHVLGMHMENKIYVCSITKPHTCNTKIKG